MSTAPSTYDTIAYPSALYVQTHPDRLATIATLHGLSPAPVERASVLELGCGDGSNLIAMAYGLPEAHFTGIDLAAEPLRRGRRVTAEVGLKNISLLQFDVAKLPGALGHFDYIVAHGLYSWVPDAAREKILALCRALLTENGIAYISYNAYPGNHLRDLARQMMRFHIRQFREPLEQVRQGRTLLKFLGVAKTAGGPWQDCVRHEFERVEKYMDAALYHDDLSAENRPFYFHEFAEAAAQHELQFLADADFSDGRVAGLAEEVAPLLDQINRCEVTVREQYLDFIVGRNFRQDLLCHREVTVDRRLGPERVAALYAASDAGPVATDADLTGSRSEDFRRGTAVIATGDPLLKSALTTLARFWPARLKFGTLLSTVRSQSHAGRRRVTTAEEDAHTLGEFLIRGYSIGFVDLHAHAGRFVSAVSECPEASRLARWQVEHGLGVSSLRHQPLKIEDALGRELLRLLDGTRDHTALLQALQSAATPAADAPPLSAAELDNSLRGLARLGLLEA
jgi:SAM-dependent methyltransferase